MAFGIALRWSALCGCVLLSAGASGSAGVHVDPVIRYFNAKVRPWLSSPLVVRTLEAQNIANARLTAAEVSALDKEWTLQVERDHRPMVDRAVGSLLSQFLRDREDEAGGTITEIIVMDARGLNAGQSGVTSDYWQGDEEKFTKTFALGPDAIYVDEARKDDSTQMFQAQVSATIADAKGRPMGAITIAINLDQL